MTDQTSEPCSATCLCQTCNGHIEFEVSQAGEVVTCPFCGLETRLFIPVQQPEKSHPKPPIIQPTNSKGRGKVFGIIGVAVVLVVAALIGFSLIPKQWEESAALQKGDVMIKVEGFYYGPDFIPNGMGMGVTPTASLFHINLSIANLSKTKKIEFNTWRPSSFDFFPARLTDSFGNSYKPIRFEVLPTYMQNQFSIYPSQSISDVLVFETPVSGVKWLRLELPASHFGGTGKIRFQIPYN